MRSPSRVPSAAKHFAACSTRSRSRRRDVRRSRRSAIPRRRPCAELGPRARRGRRGRRARRRWSTRWLSPWPRATEEIRDELPDGAHAAPARAARRCAAWCARRVSAATTSCCRSSSSRAAACASRSRRCRASSGCSVDQLADEAKRVADLGIPAVILFGIPDAKDARGSGADAADGIVQRAVAAAKRAAPDLVRDDRRLPLRVHRSRSLRPARGRRRSRTTRRSRGSRPRRSRTRAPAPTWSRPPT